MLRSLILRCTTSCGSLLWRCPCSCLVVRHSGERESPRRNKMRSNRRVAPKISLQLIKVVTSTIFAHHEWYMHTPAHVDRCISATSCVTEKGLTGEVSQPNGEPPSQHAPQPPLHLPRVHFEPPFRFQQSALPTALVAAAVRAHTLDARLRPHM